jgi:hypothetical protein
MLCNATYHRYVYAVNSEALSVDQMDINKTRNRLKIFTSAIRISIYMTKGKNVLAYIMCNNL